MYASLTECQHFVNYLAIKKKKDMILFLHLTIGEVRRGGGLGRSVLPVLKAHNHSFPSGAPPGFLEKPDVCASL